MPFQVALSFECEYHADSDFCCREAGASSLLERRGSAEPKRTHSEEAASSCSACRDGESRKIHEHPCTAYVEESLKKRNCAPCHSMRVAPIKSLCQRLPPLIWLLVARLRRLGRPRSARLRLRRAVRRAVHRAVRRLCALAWARVGLGGGGALGRRRVRLEQLLDALGEPVELLQNLGAVGLGQPLHCLKLGEQRLLLGQLLLQQQVLLLLQLQERARPCRLGRWTRSRARSHRRDGLARSARSRLLAVASPRGARRIGLGWRAAAAVPLGPGDEHARVAQDWLLRIERGARLCVRAELDEGVPRPVENLDVHQPAEAREVARQAVHRTELRRQLANEEGTVVRALPTTAASLPAARRMRRIALPRRPSLRRRSIRRHARLQLPDGRAQLVPRIVAVNRGLARGSIRRMARYAVGNGGHGASAMAKLRRSCWQVLTAAAALWDCAACAQATTRLLRRAACAPLRIKQLTHTVLEKLLREELLHRRHRASGRVVAAECWHRARHGRSHASTAVASRSNPVEGWPSRHPWLPLPRSKLALLSGRLLALGKQALASLVHAAMVDMAWL
eukprot:3140995-Pleurochrysis_carterae.AAC.3